MVNLFLSENEKQYQLFGQKEARSSILGEEGLGVLPMDSTTCIHGYTGGILDSVLGRYFRQKQFDSDFQVIRLLAFHSLYDLYFVWPWYSQISITYTLNLPLLACKQCNILYILDSERSDRSSGFTIMLIFRF